MTNVIAHDEIQAPRAICGELSILACVEADLDVARRTGTLEDVFLTLEEIYGMSMHTENEDVRAKCDVLLRGGAPTSVFS
jgi:hypothetical protein